MRRVVIKIVIIFATIFVISIILMVSWSKPFYDQQAELDILSDYCEQESLQEYSQQGDFFEHNESVPKVFPQEISQTPERFLAYIDTQVIEYAQTILLTEDFVTSLNEYQQDQFEELYADEQEPAPVVQDILKFMKNTVGGNYIFGGQGNVLTRELIYGTNSIHPDYLTAGRLEYFLNKAYTPDFEGIKKQPVYPIDYAWDCSGLWWDCVNTLEMFNIYTDRTAAQTYADYCTPVTKDELIPGDLVFYRNAKGRISHMGIVGREGRVYEAASGFVGVVCTQSLNVRIYEDIVRGGYLIFPLWNEFGRPNLYK